MDNHNGIFNGVFAFISIASVVIVIFVIYVAIHFIAKFW